MDLETALLLFTDRVLDWCRETQSDVLSTFDVVDEIWDVIRPVINDREWMARIPRTWQ